MNELKKHRLEMLQDVLNKLNGISSLYQKASPTRTLIRGAIAHIRTLHDLESDTNVDNETIGVLMKEETMHDE